MVYVFLKCLWLKMILFFVSEPERLGMIFSNTIFEAHTRTVLFTAEQIRESWRPGIDKNKLFAFKNLVSSSKRWPSLEMVVYWDIHAHLNSNDWLSLLVLLVQSPEDLWLSAAQKLTNVIKQIIEFAKLVPGFLKLPQEDQINLLKRGEKSLHIF